MVNGVYLSMNWTHLYSKKVYSSSTFVSKVIETNGDSYVCFLVCLLFAQVVSDKIICDAYLCIHWAYMYSIEVYSTPTFVFKVIRKNKQTWE